MTPTLEVTEVGLGDTMFAAAEVVQAGLRTLEFYAAAFSEEGDSQGHIIDPKAFDGWLPKFYAKGQALPISFNHAAMLDSTDPTNVIGYAPADPEHVWVDDYGLRVRGLIDTKSEKGRAVEWQIENGLLKGSSLAFLPGEMSSEKAGKVRIKTIDNVKEAGPVPNPANQDAVLLWLKSEGSLDHPTELPYMTVEEFRKVLLKEESTEEPKTPEGGEGDVSFADMNEMITKASPEELQAAHDALHAAGAKCASEEDERLLAAAEAVATPDTTGLSEEAAERARKLRLLEASLP